MWSDTLQAATADTWQNFLDRLKVSGFFAGLEEGSPEFLNRLSKAKAKFTERYPGAPVPPIRSLLEGIHHISDAVDNKAEAEKMKEKGNEMLKAGRHREAIEFYTEAIKLDATNAIYFSNRFATSTPLLD